MRLVSTCRSLIVAGVSLLGIASLVGTARADEILQGDCLSTVSGSSQNCTANDAPTLTLGINSFSDFVNGCVNRTDTFEVVKFRIGYQLVNSGVRYDVGTWINSDGSSAASGPVGTCSRFGLFPSGTLNANTCGPWHVGSTGSGPYANADGDACGDLFDKDRSGTGAGYNCNENSTGTPWDDTVYNTIGSLGVVLCSDPTTSTGFVKVPTCTTYSQQVDAVDDPADPGTDCTSAREFGLGTTAKCFCGLSTTNVPAPNMGLSCSCAASSVKAGQATACTVTYTNTIGTPNPCSFNSAIGENLQCGSAAYMQFQVDKPTSGANNIGTFFTTPTPLLTDSGDKTPTVTTSQILWTPSNDAPYGTSLGIVGPAMSDSMTFYYQTSGTAALGTYPIATVSTKWFSTTPNATTGAYTGTGSTENLSATCNLTIVSATWAQVSSLKASEQNGRVAVEWETSAEVGTTSFELERKNPRTGQFVKVTARPVPASQALPGGKYRLIDASAPLGARRLVYRLTEINQQGARQAFGPFSVAPRRDREITQTKAYAVSAKPVSARLSHVAEAIAASRADDVEALAVGPADHGKVLIPADGFYRLGARDIANGLGMSVAEARSTLQQGGFRLSQGGAEVASELSADGDGLVFYATSVHTAYTDNGVAWIERGSGTTIATVATTPASGPPAASFLDTVHAEQDLVPGLASAAPVPDLWIWKSFFPGFSDFDHADFAIGGPSPSSAAPARLVLHLFGFAATQSAEVALNGNSLGTVTWEGSGAHDATVDVPAGLLKDGGNTVQIRVVTAERGFWLDSIDLTYARRFRADNDRLLLRADPGASVLVSGFSTKDVAVYDLADGASPRRLTGGTVALQPDGKWGASFVVPAGAGPLFATARKAALAGFVHPRQETELASSAPAAEYLIVAASHLRKQAQRLADARAAQGLTTLVVDEEDVMDAFADGVADPLAYRRLLAFATANWSVSPRYLLLAGRGSYDPRNLGQANVGPGTGLALSSVLLPYFEPTGEGIASADAALADLDGSGVPAVAVGRIPALTSTEMKRFVDKILAYESEASPGWSPNALLLADNADGGGDFAATSDHIAATASASATHLTRQYLIPGADPSQVVTARADLWTALRGGQRLFNYVGHGGLDRLATEGLLLSSDVPNLQNGPRLPVMTALTCLITESAYPTFSSLGEELILQRDGGVAALYGPTWLSFNTAAGELGDHLWPQLTPRTGDRLGDRLLHGMQSYAAAGGDRQLLKFYALLGDPALKLKQ